MSYRAVTSRSLLAVSVWMMWLAGAVAQGQVTVAPSHINFAYVQGATLPALQKVAVTSAAGTPSYTTAITTNPPGGLWLTATPDTGFLPASVSFRVNPTGLGAGTYTAAVSFTPLPAAAPGTVNVSLTVTTPPPTLTLSGAALQAGGSLSFTTPQGAGASTPQVQSVQLNTSSSPISFSVSAGTAAWLAIAPASGLVMPGAPVTLRVTADPTHLVPAALTALYKAKIVVTATGAANKTLTIPVNFVVTYQTPAVTAIWPAIGQVGGPATPVTIFGTNFAAATVAKIAGTTPVGLKTTYYSPTAISAVIPAPQLAAGADLTIYASNPAPGGDSTTTVAFTFHQQVDAVVSAASYLPGASPGDLVTLFGQNIGPPVPSLMSVLPSGFVDTTTTSAFTVTVGASAGPPAVPGFLAPMVYASQNQISVQIPYEVSLGLGQNIQVTNGAAVNASGTVDIAATAPGIFTLDSSGSGQAAALNHDGTLNSGSNPEKIGNAVVLYLTGEGDYAASINPRTGFIMTTAELALLWPAPSPLPFNPPPAVTIGGKPATVTYAGPFVGGMLGVLQVNVTIPAGITTGAAVPVVVTIGGVDTHLQNVTIAAKP